MGDVIQNTGDVINTFVETSGLSGWLNQNVQKSSFLETTLLVFIILYAGVVAPKFPELMRPLADNTLVKVVFFMLLAYLGNTQPAVAIVGAVAFLLSMMYLNKRDQEGFENYLTKEHFSNCQVKNQESN
jgi:hypothetical protein